MTTIELRVPAMTCGHCEKAVRDEISKVDGVTDVSIDLESKAVVVNGDNVDRAAVFAAVAEAGYDPVE